MQSTSKTGVKGITIDKQTGNLVAEFTCKGRRFRRKFSSIQLEQAKRWLIKIREAANENRKTANDNSQATRRQHQHQSTSTQTTRNGHQGDKTSPKT